MTTPGIPARRRPSRRAPRLVAATLATVALLTGLFAPAATAAPTPQPSPTPTSSVPAGTTVFTLSPVSNGIVRPGDSLVAAAGIQNGTDAELPPAALALSLGSAPLSDRAALTAWLDGTIDDTALVPVAAGTMPAVAGGGEQVSALTVAAEDPALAGRAPGVYPLAATYATATGTVTATSVMIVPVADAPEVGIGVIVPITAGALSEGLLTADELAALTAPDGGLTAQLDGVEGTAAILAVDPAIPAAIRVLGTSAPSTATAWLERLEALPNSRFALQFGDADVTAQLQSGLEAPLTPTSFTAYMSPADFEATAPTPTPTVGPTPTPTPTPTATGAPSTTTLPDTAQLLDIGPTARAGVYWPADGTADADIVARLGALQAEDEVSNTPVSSITLVPSRTTAAGAAGSTVPAHARSGDAELLVYDSDVSGALGEASREEKSWLRGGSLTAATAYLAFATAAAGGPLLVTVGRADDHSRLGLSAAIDTAVNAPSAAPRSLGGLVMSEPAGVEITDASAPPERAAEASALLADEDVIERFATILDDPSLLTGPERAEILQLLSVAWVGREDAASEAGATPTPGTPAQETWAAALASHREATATTLDSVGLLPTSPSDLYGANAALRFWVRNDLPYPVNLVLYTTPSNLRLDVQRETPVIATPESNTRVEVPVQARVGRGDVILALQLRSPVFVAIGEPESVELNVWADWEGVGIAALAVIVGGLLVIGVVRTVLRVRRRRARRDAVAGEPDPSDARDEGADT